MSKTAMDKLVNRTVRRLNRQLQEDVFKDRFFARQYSKSYSEDGEMEYYLYELIDKECPSRNKIVHGWLSGFEITRFNKLHIEMNDFIVKSDFWEKFHNSGQKEQIK